MAESLAVKYRPKDFQDCVGQSSIIKILQKQISTGEYKHSYLFTGPSGTGKAQPLYSKVFTPNGYRCMKDITVGDTVLDGKGNITTVLGVFPQGKKNVYRISFSDRTHIDVAEDHLNVVWRRNINSGKREEFTLTTKELIELFESKRYTDVNSPLRVDIPVIDCWKDNNIDIDPYLLGCLLGDGSLHNNFSFSNTEQDILDKVSYILKRDYDMVLRQYSYCDYDIRHTNYSKHKYTFNIDGCNNLSSSELQSYLCSKGYPKFDSETLGRIAKGTAVNTLKRYPELRNRIQLIVHEDFREWNSHKCVLKEQLKSYNLLCNSCDKHIPLNYLHSSYKTRMKLLQGLMDTDGDADSRCFSTSSLRLADDFEYLVRSLGIQVTRKGPSETCYTAIVDGKKVKIAVKLAYSFYLHFDNNHRIFSSAKHTEKFVPFQNPPMRKIVSIESLGNIECQCIYVASKEHTYLTDNLTPTHNTTICRILANMINGSSAGLEELDAASNNGVDNIRTLIKSAQERSVTSKYKIYIIDECHALTNAAWQALLKCIEEPPEFTIFCFCTTDPQKIPPTIVNRCQRYNLSKISTDQLIDRLTYICKQEGYTNYQESVEYIAKVADGGARDAIATLEKVASLSTDLTIENTLEALGAYSYSMFFKLVNDIIDGNQAEVVKTVSDIYYKGNDLKLFVDSFFKFCLDVTKYCLFSSTDLIEIPPSQEENLKKSTNYYMFIVDKLLLLKNQIKNDTSVRSTVEVAFLHMSRWEQ